MVMVAMTTSDSIKNKRKRVRKNKIKHMSSIEIAQALNRLTDYEKQFLAQAINWITRNRSS